jgi:hypothetical protein
MSETIQWRRAGWYEYVRRRFSLVSFGDLADWVARRPGTVTRDETARDQALADLVSSVGKGEFGPANDKRCIPWLSKPPRADMIGKLCLRLNYGQILGMGPTIAADLYITSAAGRGWLEARQISMPPWLRPTSSPTTIEGKVEPVPRRSSRAQRPRGIDYRSADEALVHDMRALITARPPQAKDRWDAALQVSEKATGQGSGVSKAKRLMARYSAVFSD